ncbi:hypothetical protein ES703_72637 [subsurface metagenome]
MVYVHGNVGGLLIGAHSGICAPGLALQVVRWRTLSCASIYGWAPLLQVVVALSSPGRRDKEGVTIDVLPSQISYVGAGVSSATVGKHGIAVGQVEQVMIRRQAGAT